MSSKPQTTEQTSHWDQDKHGCSKAAMSLQLWKASRRLTFVRDPLHQHVELIYKQLLLTVHHPGEALLQHQSRLDRVPHAAPQLLRCLVPHEGAELWDGWNRDSHER